ncbi:MAG: hypothetical protein ACI4ML_07140 [Aristaeellaceae bacterium]
MERCFFLGHRDAERTLLTALEAVTEELAVQEHVQEFYVGAYGSFDEMAAEAVLSLKAKQPWVRLYRVLAYHPAQRDAQLPAGFDGLFDPLDHTPPPRFAIARANRSMMDQCSVLVASVQHPGYASRLLEYAQRRADRRLLRILPLP